MSFDGNKATLVMVESFPKNAGTYTAVAKNTAGEVQSSANVTIKVFESKLNNFILQYCNYIN